MFEHRFVTAQLLVRERVRDAERRRLAKSIRPEARRPERRPPTTPDLKAALLG